MAIQFAHNTQAQLDTRNLNVYINGAQILKDVNVSIPKNKITCIIGPSGCGKSTLLRTFNRLNDRVEGLKMNGEVNLGENNILEAGSSKLSEVRRNIGLVPQHPCPLPMSIYDNVAYGCRISWHPQQKKARQHRRALPESSRSLGGSERQTEDSCFQVERRSAAAPLPCQKPCRRTKLPPRR